MAFNMGDMEVLEEASKYKDGLMPRKLGMKANEILQRNGLQLYDPSMFVTEESDIPKAEPLDDGDYEDAIRNMMESKQGILPERADSASTAEDYWAKGGYDEWKNGKKDVLTPEERKFLEKFIKAHYGSYEDYDRSELKE